MDYYKTLGLIPNVESVVIKAAYKALAQIHHPDKNNDNKNMVDINTAYTVLSNPIKKAEYDSEIEKRSSSASRSSFTTVSPFCSDPLESDWRMAISFYPFLKEQHKILSNISWDLAFSFKVLLLETQDFKNSHEISKEIKFYYLSRYFGCDKEVMEYAESLIINKEIDPVLYLNSLVRVMGGSVTKLALERMVNEKYSQLNCLRQGIEAYSNLKRMNGYYDYNSAYVETLKLLKPEFKS